MTSFNSLEVCEFSDAIRSWMIDPNFMVLSIKFYSCWTDSGNCTFGPTLQMQLLLALLWRDSLDLTTSFFLSLYLQFEYEVITKKDEIHFVGIGLWSMLLILGDWAAVGGRRLCALTRMHEGIGWQRGGVRFSILHPSLKTKNFGDKCVFWCEINKVQKKKKILLANNTVHIISSLSCMKTFQN